MFYVYILYSESLSKYYVGSTQDPVYRLQQHNRGKSPFTRKGVPWQKIHIIACETRSEAIQLETKIKKRGIERFLDDSQHLQ